MSKVKELLKQGKRDELWQLCCGYIDLSIDEFMAIQKQLLSEQIQLLKRSALGRKVMRDVMPDNVDEFRQQVPLTSFIDYCPELLEKRENCLPEKPVRWAHTSGKSGEFPFKWVPITAGAMEEMAILIYGANLFATCKRKGDASVHPSKFLFATAPAPYTSGIFGYKCEEEFGWKYFPSPEESEHLSFMERMDKGFWMALDQGIDAIYGLTAMLVAIGERFKSGSRAIKMSTLAKHPRALLRVSWGLLKSKLAGRTMLPKDLWKIKAMACGGTDSQIFRKKIKEMWGVIPLDIYAGTEGLIMSMQTWDFDTMTFVPNLNFFEFIPESEYFKWKADRSYKPETVLLDEVEAGKIYEIVITNFHGGIMTRYRPGDMIKITSLKNQKLGINLPQMVFERRADDLIDIGYMRLTEKVIWKALENTGIPYVDWTARKEITNGTPALHLYVEPRNPATGENLLENAIYMELKKLNDGFIHGDLPDIEKIMDYKPVTVSFLPQGSFSRYSTKRHAEGADLAQLKPPHINPSDSALELLGLKAEPTRQVQVVYQEKKELAPRQ